MTETEIKQLVKIAVLETKDAMSIILKTTIETVCDEMREDRRKDILIHSQTCSGKALSKKVIATVATISALGGGGILVIAKAILDKI